MSASNNEPHILLWGRHFVRKKPFKGASIFNKPHISHFHIDDEYEQWDFIPDKDRPNLDLAQPLRESVLIVDALKKPYVLPSDIEATNIYTRGEWRLELAMAIKMLNPEKAIGVQSPFLPNKNDICLIRYYNLKFRVSLTVP
jgi:hypothetical protein